MKYFDNNIADNRFNSIAAEDQTRIKDHFLNKYLPNPMAGDQLTEAHQAMVEGQRPLFPETAVAAEPDRFSLEADKELAAAAQESGIADIVGLEPEPYDTVSELPVMPEAGGVVEQMPEDQRSIADPQGYMESLAEGLTAGVLDVASIPFAITHAVAEQVEGEGALEIGARRVRDFLKEKAEEHPMAKELQGKNLWDNPEIILDPRFTLYGVGNMAPSFLAAMLPGAAALRFGKLAATAIGGISAGMMEGANTYGESRERGNEPDEAFKDMMLMTVGSAVLNQIGFTAIFSKYKGKKLVMATVAALTEGATEYAEEPLEAEILGMEGAEYRQKMKDGLAVIGPAMIMGGGGSAVSGYIQKAQENRVKALEEEQGKGDLGLEQEEQLIRERKIRDDMQAAVKEKLEAEKTVEGDKAKQPFTKELGPEVEAEVSAEEAEALIEDEELAVAEEPPTKPVTEKEVKVKKEVEKPKEEPTAKKPAETADELESDLNKMFGEEVTTEKPAEAAEEVIAEEPVKEVAEEEKAAEKPEEPAKEEVSALAAEEKRKAEEKEPATEIEKKLAKAVEAEAEITDDTRKFIEDKVSKLGTVEAVDELYKSDKPVDVYAREHAREVFEEKAEEKEEEAQAEVAPEPEVVAEEKGEEKAEAVEANIESVRAAPTTKDKLYGYTVRKAVPNMGSIESTYDEGEYEILPGVRDVSMDAFTVAEDVNKPSHSATENERIRKLADEIKSNKEINPLIVAIEDKGPYILEGGHRFDALAMLGVKSFPAVIVDASTPPAKPEPAAPVTEAAGMKEEVKPVLDAAAIQAKKNDIREGEMILESGKNVIGKKMSKDALAAVARQVEKDKRKLTELEKSAPPVEDAPEQREEVKIEPELIFTSTGRPFKSQGAAQRKAKSLGEDYEAVKTFDGYAVRRSEIKEVREYAKKHGYRVVKINPMSPLGEKYAFRLEKDGAKMHARAFSDAKYLIDSREARLKKKPAAEEVKPTEKPPEGKLRFATREGKPAAKPKSVKFIEDAVKPLAAKIDVPVNTVQSVEDLPAQYQDAVKAEMEKGGVIRGFFDPTTEEMYLIADSLRQRKKAVSTVLHEVVAHYGLRRVLGSGIDEFYRKELIEHKKYKDEIQGIADRWNIPLEKAAEEMLAGQIEDGTVAPSLLDRLMAFIRRTLKAIGVRFAFSEAELRVLLDDALRASMGRKRAEREAGQPLFARTLDPVAIEKEIQQVSELLANLPPMRNGVSTENIQMRYLQKIAELERQMVAAEQGLRFARTDVSADLERTIPQIDDETNREKFVRVVVDKLNRIETIQKAYDVVPQTEDTRLAAELFPGRVSHELDKLEDFLTKGRKSFMVRLAQAGYSVGKLGGFMYAKHTAERRQAKYGEMIDDLNAQLEAGVITPEVAEKELAKLSARLEDRDDTFGAGISLNQAAVVLDRYEGTGIEEFADEFRKKIINVTLERYRDYGEITEEAYQKYKDQYNYYVPLKGKAGKKAYRGIGKGFSVSGKSIKRAHGRWSIADNPFVQAIVDYEQAVMREEKNKVASTFLEFVRNNPHPLWDAKEVFNPSTINEEGEIAFRDPASDYAHEIFAVKEEGKTIEVTIRDVVLARAMKSLGTESTVPIIGGALELFNTIQRGVITTFSPVFPIFNFIRDTPTATFHITSDHGFKLATKTLASLPAAINGVRGNIRSDADKGWAAEYEDLKATGGKVGWFDNKPLEQRIKQLERKVRSYTGKGRIVAPIKVLGQLIQDYNEMVESGIRLSVYHHLKGAGATKEVAASYAKNVTVNFNKKGEIGRILNSLYLFSNATIQGIARNLRTIGIPGKPKTAGQVRAQALIGLIIATAFLNELKNRMIDPDDWEEVADFQKDQNATWHLGGGRTLSVPLPYGLNVYWALGGLAAEMALGNNPDPVKLAARMVGAVADAASPVGGGPLTQIISPTALDLPVQLATNKTFFGGPVAPDQPAYGPKKPRHQLYFKGVRPSTREFTRWLAEKTATQRKPFGAADVSPEYIDHTINFLGGGIGKFVSNSVATGISLATDEKIETRFIPVMRRFYRKPYPGKSKQTVYGMLDDAATTVFTAGERERFKSAVDRAVADGSMEKKTAKSVKSRFIKEQRKINPELKAVPVRESPVFPKPPDPGKQLRKSLRDIGRIKK
ncbi:MAG: ParB N-terminal domain-containing protein [Bacteroidales bacterium]|nr:ParB N-terminal domain-containing protein [Candidatus Latescibacterota bacterium]